MKQVKRKWGTVTSIAIILALALLITGKGLVPGRVPGSASLLLESSPWKTLNNQTIPAEPIFTDILLVIHPWLIYAAKEINRGVFPLWNPHSYAGAPFFANMQSALLSPFSFPAYFINIPTAIGLSLLLKLLVAGTSMFWFLRLVGLSPVASLTGGTTFMLSGFIIAWLGWPLASAGVWIPLLLALIEKSHQSPRPHWVVLLATVIALNIFSGHPETSAFGILAAFIYSVVIYKRNKPTRNIRILLIPFALGILLAAVQIIPFLEYMKNGSALYARNSGTPLMVLPLECLMLFFSPDYWGWMRDGTKWTHHNLVEATCSVGISPWLLLPCAAMFYWNSIRWRFAVIIALLSILIAYNFPLAPWLFSKLPVFHLVANTRIILLAGLGLAISVGFGVEGALNCPPERRKKAGILVAGTGLIILLLAWYRYFLDQDAITRGKALNHVLSGMTGNSLLLIAAALVIIIILSGWKHRARLALLLVLIQAAGIVPFALRYWPTVHERYFYPATGAIDMLKDDNQYSRTVSRVLLTLPNISSVYGLYDVSGYDAINPRFTEILMGSRQASGGFGNGADFYSRGFNSPILDIFGVKYIFYPTGAGTPSGKFIRAYEGNDSTVFRNLNVFPRAFLANKSLFLLSEQHVLDKMCSGFDLRNTVLLMGAPPSSVATPAPSPIIQPGIAQIQDYESNRVVINTNNGVSSWLVLTDTWYPGWQATIDGRKTRIYRADYAFRAVPVPAGAHTIVFSYLPGSFLLGLGLTILGLLICIRMIFEKGRGPA